MTDSPLGAVTISDAIIGDAHSGNVASGSVAIADASRGDVVVADRVLGDVSISSVLSDEAIAPMLIQGIQDTPLLTLEGSSVASYPNALFYEDRTWSDQVMVPTDQIRAAQYLKLRATGGGTYGDAGAFPNTANSNHIGLYLDASSNTPTQLYMCGYSISQFARGDAGFAVGATEVYSEGLLRGVEHTSRLGHLQAQATLTGGTTGSTTLPYTSALNESTFGVGRVLIDIDIAYNTGTVTVSRQFPTVTGAGGANWGTDVIGQYFKVNSDDRTLGGVNASAWYKIVARPDAQTLTLEDAYRYTSATGAAYSISPGVAVTAFDTTAKTITVAANTIAWTTGHRVQFRIHLFSQVTPFVGIQSRSLPYLGNSDASFVATQLATDTERAGAGFLMAPGTFESGFFMGGPLTDMETGIRGGEATISSSHFMTLPLTKRITWGTTTPWSDLNQPCVVADASNNINFMYGNVVKGTFLRDGGLYVRHTDGVNNLLDLRNPNDVTLTAVNSEGVILPVQAPTVSAPAYVKGGLYFDTTLNKLRVGGATGWETVTSV